MLRRIILLTALLALSSAGMASQSNLVLPTTGIVSAVEFSAAVSNALASLNTCNSGATAPANGPGAAPQTGQCWDDTSSSPTVRKLYDGAQWLVVGAIDATGHVWMPPVGGGVASLASAATTDLCSTPATYLTVTGTTTITSFGATSGCPEGQIKVIRFSASLLLTHNAVTLVLPGSASKTTGAGDVAIAVKATSGGRWEVANYMVAAAPVAASPASAVPVGTMLDFSGFTAPTDYEFCGNQTISRATSPDYVAANTSTQTVTRTNGSAILTGFTSTAQFAGGMDVEGTGIPGGATITALTSTTVTISAAYTGTTGSGAVTVFAVGNGNGSTTINVPDARGRVKAGRDDMNTAASRLTVSSASTCYGAGLGIACGGQTGTLTEAQLPAVSRTVTISGTTGGGGAHNHDYDDHGSNNASINEGDLGSSTVANNATVVRNSGSADPTTHTHTFSGSDGVSFGSGNSHSRVQPTLITNCIVRVR